MRVLTAFGATAAAAAVLAAGASATPSPALRLVSDEPLVVRGLAFRPGERVTVTAHTLLGPTRVVTRASRGGLFRATLRPYNQPCGRAFSVRALGALGSRATLQLRSEPCIPPLID